MKKMMIAFISMLTMAATGNAMSYEQARNEALFLTDKMAYELNLTQEQYEAAYEINLDYLMGVTSYDDVYALGWERRNADLSYILFDWQMSAFRAASYFYRPLYWHNGLWHFGVYARYPHRDYFYFGRPVFYASYRGEHSWRMNGNRSWYQGRRHVYAPNDHHNHFGMKDGWDRGDFRNNRHGMRNSSTRTTVNNRDWRNNDTHHRNWNNNRDNNKNRDWNNNRGNNNRDWNSNRNNNNRDNNNRDNNRNWNNNRDNNNRSLGGYRSNSSNNNRSWTTTNRDNSNHSTFGRDNNRTINSANHSFGGSSTRSVGSGSSTGGGGRSTGSGHSYGGRR